MQVIVRSSEAACHPVTWREARGFLDRAVVNVARWTDAGLAGCHGGWHLLNPARQLRLDTRLGRVAPGYDADLTAMNDGAKS